MRRWQPALRGRLVAAAAAATLVAVAGLGLAVVLLVNHELHSELDSTLRQRAIDVARLAISDPALLRAAGALDAPFGGRQLAVEVVDRHGGLYARSLSLGDRVLPGGATLAATLVSGRSAYRDTRVGGDRFRLFVGPLTDAGSAPGGGAVLVASSTSEIDGTLRRLRALVLLSALIAAGAGAILAALLTHRGLRPLRRLAQGASAIAETSDASRRLEAPDEGGELGDLAVALNAMLAALERARQTERRFLADASHELRTPLTSLRGNASFVAAHGADPAALRDIEADAARLARLVDDLLVLERETASERPQDAVNLRDVVDAVAPEDDRVRVTVAPGAEGLRVRGERDALERALANLVENARVHGPAGGQIEVRLEQDGDRALLSVTDEGRGLDPQLADLALRRFWRGPDAGERPGSGLGLSIVALVAARHDGAVRISGARFTIELPALTTFSKVPSTLASQPEQGPFT